MQKEQMVQLLQRVHIVRRTRCARNVVERPMHHGVPHATQTTHTTRTARRACRVRSLRNVHNVYALNVRIAHDAIQTAAARNTNNKYI